MSVSVSMLCPDLVDSISGGGIVEPDIHNIEHVDDVFKGTLHCVCVHAYVSVKECVSVGVSMLCPDLVDSIFGGGIVEPGIHNIEHVDNVFGCVCVCVHAICMHACPFRCSSFHASSLGQLCVA